MPAAVQNTANTCERVCVTFLKYVVRVAILHIYLTWGIAQKLNQLQRLLKAPQFSTHLDKKEEDLLIIITGYAPVNEASLV